jgi:hypothetical protein
MGIFVQTDLWGTGRWYTNDGVDPGYHADMMYLPDLDLTIVLSANASLWKADMIYEGLLSSVVQVALDAVRENAVRTGTRIRGIGSRPANAFRPMNWQKTRQGTRRYALPCRRSRPDTNQPFG